ncbi:dihydrofolate reductase [Carnobacterium mobile]|uniref:dihydrofolate reductase n=1 Tax=Carnobacterium mobile TaxID=2750 RepID=UPI00054FFB27|nr:dihydrofolate reductase [Carnobacterium mobile]
MIAFLWAQDQQGLIGNKGTLPWRLPNDLKFFKEKTQGNAVVMGRKTFEGMNKRPLPNRINIVMTTDEKYQAEGVLVMHSPKEVLDFADHYQGITFITGGSDIFKLFEKNAYVLYRTMIDGEFEGDTFMPDLDWSKWQLVDMDTGIVDERNKYAHTFETYRRK